MSNNNKLSRLICDNMKLKKLPPKDEGDWLWQEKDGKERQALKLALANKDDLPRSVAFSLDKNSARVGDYFPFFIEGDEDLGNVSAICDIIVLTSKSDALCAFVIEVKSSNADNKKANQQIKNGVCFCKWLHCLLKENYPSQKKLEVVKILCYVRPEETKTFTTHKKSKNPYWVKDTQTIKYQSEAVINLDEARGFYRKKRDKTRTDE